MGQDLYIKLDEGTTGISPVKVSEQDTPLYDTQGLRLTQPAKGSIYIKGGRKYISR